MYQNIDETGTPADDPLAADWALFQAVEAGTARGLARCWQSAVPLVVVGRNGSVGDEVIEAACRDDGVPVIRRFSGGGTVVLGPGTWNYAVALSLVSRPVLGDVALSLKTVLGAIVEALGVPDVRVAGADLVYRGRKVSGNAQRRGRRALLHHGTLLYDFDASLATRYLKEPARQPAYRAGRHHAEFLGNLPLSREAVRRALQRASGVLCER